MQYFGNFSNMLKNISAGIQRFNLNKCFKSLLNPKNVLEKTTLLSTIHLYPTKPLSSSCHLDHHTQKH